MIGTGINMIFKGWPQPSATSAASAPLRLPWIDGMHARDLTKHSGRRKEIGSNFLVAGEYLRRSTGVNKHHVFTSSDPTRTHMAD